RRCPSPLWTMTRPPEDQPAAKNAIGAAVAMRSPFGTTRCSPSSQYPPAGSPRNATERSWAIAVARASRRVARSSPTAESSVAPCTRDPISGSAIAAISPAMTSTIASSISVNPRSPRNVVNLHHRAQQREGDRADNEAEHDDADRRDQPNHRAGGRLDLAAQKVARLD